MSFWDAVSEYLGELGPAMVDRTKNMVANPLETLNRALTETMFGTDPQTMMAYLEQRRRGERPEFPGTLGFGVGGITKVAPFDAALDAARAQAALSKAEGGLGLGPENTALERATAMGYTDPAYTGSLFDLLHLTGERGKIGGHAGRGVYTTPAAQDASENYASIFGPDYKLKAYDTLEGLDVPPNRIIQAIEDETLSPARAEVVGRNALNADHLGAVYPWLIRKGKNANAVDPESGWWIPSIADDPRNMEDAWSNVRGLIEEYVPRYEEGRLDDILYDYMESGGPSGSLWDAIRKSNIESYNVMGDPYSPGGLASEILRELGADSVTHHTNWRQPRLNIAGEHTVLFRPGLVRSVNAAFNPKHRFSSDVLAGLGALGLAGGLGYNIAEQQGLLDDTFQ